MKYTYLLINFFTIIVPLMFSFHPKLQFHKTWKAFFPAVFLVGSVFVAWDMYFTSLGVWGFNKDYLSGIEIVNLPLEEVLFFFCIPYACVFTYHCLNVFFPKEAPKKLESKITAVIILMLLLMASLHWDKIYTSSTFISLALVVGICSYLLKVNWLIKAYLIYTVLLLPFFIVNGLLTGTGLEKPVVWYNESEYMGIRILSIPLEDVFYGLELILLNLLVYKKLLEIFGKAQAKVNEADMVEETISLQKTN